MPVLKRVNKDFFKNWSPEMAYVLGFFAADGYITVNRRGGQFWSIQITDLGLLECIRKAVGAEHLIGIRLPKGNEKILYRLQIGSIEMCGDLRALGYDVRKTKSLAVPNVPQQYLGHFVRGYFDGDGNVWKGFVHKDRSCRLLAIRSVFTSCSDAFLSVLKKRLADAGIDPGALRRGNGNYSTLTYSIAGSLKLYDFMYNASVHLKSGLFLERKKKVFEMFMEESIKT